MSEKISFMEPLIPNGQRKRFLRKIQKESESAANPAV